MQKVEVSYTYAVQRIKLVH